MAENDTTSRLILDGNTDGLTAAMQKATAAVESGTAQITGAFGKVGGSINNVIGIVGTLGGIVAGGAAFKHIISETVSWDLETAKLAKTLGITTQEASIFKVGLHSVGIEQDVAAAAALRLSKTMATNEEIFRQLGVTIKDQDGNYRSTTAVMADVNDRLNSMTAGFDRNIPAMQIYGRSWGELQQMLKLNNQVMEEAKETATRLNLVVTKDNVEGARQYKAALRELDLVHTSLERQIGERLLPTFIHLGAFLNNYGPAGASLFAQSLAGLTRIAAESGVVIGASYDKMQAWLDTGGLMGHMFSKEKSAEYAKRIAQIDEAAGAQMAEIYKTLTSATGKGKVSEGDRWSPGTSGGGKDGRPSWATSPTNKTFFSQAWDKAADEIAYEDALALVLKVNDLGSSLKFGPKKQSLGIFTLEPGVNNLGPYAQFAQERLRLEEQYKGGVSQIQAEIAGNRLTAMGEEEQALEVHYAYKEQKLAEDYGRQISHAHSIGMDTTLVLQQYQLQQIQLEEEKAQRLAEIWWNNSQTYINFAQQMTTMGLQYLLFDENQRGQIGKRMLATSIRFIAQGLQAYMFSKAKEHVLNAASAAGRTTMDMTAANANLGILQAQATAQAAYLGAMCLIPYVGATYAPAFAAMTAVAGVAVPSAIATVNAIGATSIAYELGMAAAWGAGGILVGALGEAGATAIEGGTSGSTNPAGYGAGSPSSPVVTQPVQQTQQGQVTVVVNMTGAMYADKDKMARWMEDEFAPMMRDFVNRNVNFGFVVK